MYSAEWKIRGSFFQGSFHSPQSKDFEISKSSPADQGHLWHTALQFSDAVSCAESASKAQKQWASKHLEKRISLLRDVQKNFQQRADSIAQAIAWEVGKPLWEAKTEASALSAKVDVTLNESLKRIQSKEFDNILPDVQGQITYRSIGPVAVIGPFNFPCHLPNTQILSALLAGSTVVFKPSEKTIFSAQCMAECFIDAGLPPGVFNFLVGHGEMASDLVSQRSIRGVHFTGSLAVGQKIIQQTCQDISKLVALELGGRNTSIVMPDAHQEHAMTELIKSCFLTSGQRCTSTTTIAVHNSILEEFTEEFKKLSSSIRVDHPVHFGKEPFMGPLIDIQAAEKFDSMLARLRSESFEMVLDEKLAKTERGQKGPYRSPVIALGNKDQLHSPLLQEEVFGPLAVIVPFESLDQAIEIANATPYGLSSAVFTNDGQAARRCFQEIEAGIINHNRSTVGASAKLPFGGVKQSGNHRPAAVSMIDSCVFPVSSLTTKDQSSDRSSIKGLEH